MSAQAATPSLSPGLNIPAPPSGSVDIPFPVPPGMELPKTTPTKTATTTIPALGVPPMPGGGDKIAGAPDNAATGAFAVPPPPTTGVNNTSTSNNANNPSPTNNAQTAGVFTPPPVPAMNTVDADVKPESKLATAPTGIIFPPSNIKSATGIVFPNAVLPELVVEGKRVKTWQTKLKPTPQPPLANFNYRRQLLPDAIYRKAYSRDNQHLPLAVYAEDYDHLFLQAAANNDIDGTRALLNSGRNVNLRNADGDPVLVIALRHQAIDTARLLLARGANPGLAGADGRSAYDVAQGMGLSGIMPRAIASPIVYSRR